MKIISIQALLLISGVISFFNQYPILFTLTRIVFKDNFSPALVLLNLASLLNHMPMEVAKEAFNQLIFVVIFHG